MPDPPVAVPGPASASDRCACGAPLVSCHGCAESRCLTCDPYSEYERMNQCCAESDPPGPASVSPAEPHPAKLENAALTLAYRAEDVADHLMDNGLAPRVQLLRDAVLDLRYAVTRARDARRAR